MHDFWKSKVWKWISSDYLFHVTSSADMLCSYSELRTFTASFIRCYIRICRIKISDIYTLFVHAIISSTGSKHSPPVLLTFRVKHSSVIVRSLRLTHTAVPRDNVGVEKYSDDEKYKSIMMMKGSKVQFDRLIKAKDLSLYPWLLRCIRWAESKVLIKPLFLIDLDQYSIFRLKNI